MLQAKAAYEQELAMQGYEVVRAPFDGIVTARFVDPGTLIPAATAPVSSTPNAVFYSTSSTSTPIVSLASQSPLRVYAFVPQSISSFIKDGDPATVTVIDYPNRKFTGTVTRHPEALDQTTRTMQVEVDLPNQDRSLLPGMYANMKMTAHVTVSEPDRARRRARIPQRQNLFAGGARQPSQTGRSDARPRRRLHGRGQWRPSRGRSDRSERRRGRARRRTGSTGREQSKQIMKGEKIWKPSESQARIFSFRASVLARGRWADGCGAARMKQESIRTIHSAVDRGITLIDTAPVYGFGRSEEIVGKALASGGHEKSRDDRHQGRTRLEPTNEPFRNATRSRIFAEVEASLKRLRTDVIDIYQVHWPDPMTPISETADAMAALLQAGQNPRDRREQFFVGADE